MESHSAKAQEACFFATPIHKDVDFSSRTALDCLRLAYFPHPVWLMWWFLDFVFGLVGFRHSLSGCRMALPPYDLEADEEEEETIGGSIEAACKLYRLPV